MHNFFSEIKNNITSVRFKEFEVVLGGKGLLSSIISREFTEKITNTRR